MAGKEFGIDNCLVFASGTIALPKISKVIKINLNNESELDWVRSLIYGNERHGIRTENNELFQIYDGTNFSFYNYTEQIVFDSQNRDGKPNGTRSSREVEQTRKGSEVVTRNSIDKAYSQAIKWKGITYYDEFNNDVPRGQAAISKRNSEQNGLVGRQQTVGNEYNSGSTEEQGIYGRSRFADNKQNARMDGVSSNGDIRIDSEGKVPYQSELSQFRYSTDKDGEVVTRNSIDKETYNQAIKWKGITYYDEFNNDVPRGQAAISKRVSGEKNAVGEQQTVSNEYNSGSTERRAMYAGVGLSNQQSRELGLDSIPYDSRSGLDSEGNTLSPQQAEFFKDSKVRDENGNLLVMYHGTNNDFTIFENSRIGSNTNNEGIFGKGFYFTNNKALAKNYNRKNGDMFFA